MISAVLPGVCGTAAVRRTEQLPNIGAIDKKGGAKRLFDMTKQLRQASGVASTTPSREAGGQIIRETSRTDHCPLITPPAVSALKTRPPPPALHACDMHMDMAYDEVAPYDV